MLIARNARREFAKLLVDESRVKIEHRNEKEIKLRNEKEIVCSFEEEFFFLKGNSDKNDWLRSRKKRRKICITIFGNNKRREIAGTEINVISKHTGIGVIN